MSVKILTKPFRKLLVVGPLYDKKDKMAHVEEMISQYDYVIFNGGLCTPRHNLDDIEARRIHMSHLIDKSNVIYVAGRTDYLLAVDPECPPALTEWIRQCPNVVIADFPTRSLSIMDGGLPENLKQRHLLFNNLEVSFISQIKKKPWHQNYNGGLGYVISNNPLTNKFPQHYNYSMQLGNFYGDDGQCYAQEVDEIGLKQTILL